MACPDRHISNRSVARKDERHFVRDRIHRIPRGALIIRLRAAWKVLCAGFGIAEMDNSLRAPEVGFLGRKIDKAVRIAGHFSYSAVITTVLSFARRIASISSRSGIFLKMASKSVPSLPIEAVIWKWKVLLVQALPLMSNADAGGWE